MLGPQVVEQTDCAPATEAGEHLPESGRPEGGGAGAGLPQPPASALLLDQHQGQASRPELPQLEVQRAADELVSHPVKPGQHPGLELHTSCPSTNTKTATYRLCVAVRRLGYPQEAMAIGPGSKAWVQPAHSITFLPPVTLLNLLPCQLEYKVQDTELRGAVRPGAETPLLIDISTIYVLDFFLEAFPGLGSLIM